MVKKIVFSILVFTGAFVVSALMFFPFDIIAAKIIKNVTDTNKIDLRYDTLNVGLFGARMTDIKSQDFVIDSVTLKYNPLGLLFKRVSFDAVSPLFIIKGNLAGSELSAEATVSVAGVTKLAKIEGSGSVKANLGYNIKTYEGKLGLTGGAIKITHPLMSIETDSLSAAADVKNNLVTINNVDATGKTKLNGKGSININTKRPDFSVIDFSGSAGMMGLNMNFRLQGPIAKPQFNVQ